MLDYVIEEVDRVLVMTVNPGYMGQKLVPQTLRKVEQLRKTMGDLGLDCKIAVDGNVNYENVPNMVSAGADVLVGGSSGLFRRHAARECHRPPARACCRRPENRTMSVFRLGINTGFAVNRYAEPEEWGRIVGEELRLKTSSSRPIC